MNRFAFVMAMFGLVMVSANTASALTLKEKKQYQEWVKELNDPSESYLKKTKEKCGYEISATLEEKFTTPFMAANTSASAYCESVRSQIATMCEDATSKEAIKSKIKKISCVLGKEKEIAFKVSGGTLLVTVGLNAANIGDKTKEYLENNL